ncbi:MAG: hypothetical protein WBG18_20785 [Xanthobacteraceae bacterium]
MYSKRADVGDAHLNLVRPFAVFRARRRDRHRTGIQTFFGTLTVPLGVFIADIARNNFAGDKAAVGGRGKLGREPRHFWPLYKSICSDDL